jgi:hypothetical protein
MQNTQIVAASPCSEQVSWNRYTLSLLSFSLNTFENITRMNRRMIETSAHLIDRNAEPQSSRKCLSLANNDPKKIQAASRHSYR